MLLNKDLANWQHSHLFNEGNPIAEKKTKLAVLLTFITMLVEIIGGYVFNSMALLADGWHMSSHALALGLAALAYSFARKYAFDRRFTFGTWKIEILSSFTSAILLVLIALLMFGNSIERLIKPTEIHYNQAIIIAFIGLLVNLACAWLLKDGHHHHHHHHGSHSIIHEHHHDMNLRAAYIHVITDAATSVLAIIALVSGKFFGAAWLDPLMGIVGACLVSIWAYGLICDSGKILLDAEMSSPLAQEIKQVIEHCPIQAKVCDLHLWRVGKEKFACIIGLVTSENTSPDYFRNQLSIHKELVHITIEINRYQPNKEFTSY